MRERGYLPAMINEQDLYRWTQRIVEVFHPQQIILFGSYAEGHPREDSDVDLLVVMSYTDRPFKIAAKIRMALEEVLNQAVSLDILVRTPNELDARLNMGDQFMQTIVQKGKTLYGKP